MKKIASKRTLSLILALIMLSLPTAAAADEPVLGDVNRDGAVDINDSIALFQHSMLPDLYPIEYPGTFDMNKDGMFDVNDSIRLFQYSMLPELYPIEWEREAEEFVMINPKKAFDAVGVSLSFTNNTLCSSSFDTERGEGTDVSYSAWVGTDAIALNGCYGLYYNLAAHRLLMSVAFYDAEGNYISGIGTNSMNIYATSVTGFVVRPENAVTARFLTFTGTYVIPSFDERGRSSVLSFATEDAYNEAKSMYRYDSLKIACLGDSLTEGDYGPINGRQGGRRFDNYPYYLGQYTGATVVNFGRCGANATSYLNEHYNVGDIDVSDFDVILLMLGTNKGLAFDSQYYTDYCTLIDKILAEKKPGARLILITPPSATTDPLKINYGYMDDVLTANEAVIAVAKEKGLICIDALKNSPIQPEKEAMYQSYDGLHFNARGYEAFAKYIAGELSKYID